MLFSSVRFRTLLHQVSFLRVLTFFCCVSAESMFKESERICMQFTCSSAPVLGYSSWPTSDHLSVAKLFATFCYYCGCELFPMSAVPQGAFLAMKYRQNEKKKPKEQGSFYDTQRNMELNPVQYNGKMMNSIWGLYNRYSVHNLKKNIDKVAPVTMNQQIQSVGSSGSGAKCPTSSSVVTNAWNSLQSTFGNPH